MDLVMFFNLFGLLLFTFFALPTLYQLQIKEYFYPRIREGMKEQQGFFIPLKMPAFSPRNILIMGFVFIVMATYFYLLGYYFSEVTLWYAFLWAFGTILSKLATFLGMLITEPLAAIKRNKYMRDAKEKRESSQAEFIGITGSYGKTSTTEFLATLLSKKYKVGTNDNNKNSEVGVSLSILKNLNEDTDFFVAEMGAYTLGTIERSASIVQPKYGILTGIGNQHVSLFGSQENLIDAKCELVEALPEDGVLYLNADSKYIDEALKKAECKVVTYSVDDPSADIFTEIKEDKMAVKYGDKEYVFKTGIDVEHHILNLSVCVAFALDMNLTKKEIQEVLDKLELPKQKLSKHKLKSGGVLIDDSYNCNREGFLEALDYIGNSSRKKIVLTRGMIELGESKSEVYEEIVDSCKEIEAKLITTDRDFLQFRKDYSGIELCSSKELIEKVKEVKSEEIILLEGRFSPNFMKELKGLYEA